MGRAGIEAHATSFPLDQTIEKRACEPHSGLALQQREDVGPKGWLLPGQPYEATSEPHGYSWVKSGSRCARRVGFS